MQPLGRASFFPSESDLKKKEVKLDYEDLNSRLFKYKGMPNLSSEQYGPPKGPYLSIFLANTIPLYQPMHTFNEPYPEHSVS